MVAHGQSQIAPTKIIAYIGVRFVLSIEQAKQELKIAVERNPGPWEQHSLVSADNARRIAEKVPGMDPAKAYFMGLLHDIGRRAGVTGMRHIVDGYKYLVSIGEWELAHICITHSYPVRDPEMYAGNRDCTPEEEALVRQVLMSREYDNYDRFIQLCDAISLPKGACIMEKRFVDVVMRHGMESFTVDKWKAYYEIKKHFDNLCGCDIYTLLPGIFENSIKSL